MTLLTPAHKALLLALAATALAWSWMALTVHYNYQDRWTALFVTGKGFHAPPEQLRNENIYLFPGTGFDGQMYHYIAHDPFLLRGFQKSMDDPRFRYRRILVPLAAWTLALGRDEWIDTAYISVTLGFLFLGVYWLAMLAGAHGRSPALGVLFLLSPAAIISIDRMTVDIAASALVLAVLYYFSRGCPAKLWLSAAAACLSRESAAVVPAALAAYSFCQDRRFRQPVLLASAVLPAALWSLYSANQTPASTAVAGTLIPFRYFIGLIIDPFDYKLPQFWRIVAQGGDMICLAGLALCVWYSAARWRELRASEAGWTLLAWVLFFAFIGVEQMWTDPYNYGRVFTPMILFVAVNGFRRMDRIAFLPLLLFVPRIVLQLGSQILVVARGLLQMTD